MARNLRILAGVLAFVAIAACDALPPAPLEYVIPSPAAANVIRSMTTGPDGNIWFTYTSASSARDGHGSEGAIGSISSDGAVREFVDPSIVNPMGIAPGLDGALWFTDDTEIGRITTSGQISKFALPGTHALRIAEGLDRRLWFTEAGDQIGSIDLGGNVVEYPLPSIGAGLQGIAAGSDGNWFAESALNRIGRISLAGGVTVAEFPIPTAQSGAQEIVQGPDGNFWFTEQAAGKIGRIMPGGAITEFALDAGSHPTGIVSGPDGNLWYADTSGKIGRISPAGKVVEFLFKQDTGVLWLSFGADGSLWFTKTGGLGRLISLN
jgi:streptogramin lyase